MIMMINDDGDDSWDLTSLSAIIQLSQDSHHSLETSMGLEQ